MRNKSDTKKQVLYDATFMNIHGRLSSIMNIHGRLSSVHGTHMPTSRLTLSEPPAFSSFLPKITESECQWSESGVMNLNDFLSNSDVL